MKKFSLVFLALTLCLTACLCLFSCTKKISEEEWRTAFAFENVRVDCTIQPWQSEPYVGEPLHGGTHYLFDGDTAAVANVEQQLIGSDESTFHEKLFEDRQTLIRLFDFSDCFEEFTLLEDGTYFCEKSSLKSIMWVDDYIQNVYVTFADGQVSKIVYTYYSFSLAQPEIYTFTFSEYGQVVLEAPAE